LVLGQWISSGGDTGQRIDRRRIEQRVSELSQRYGLAVDPRAHGALRRLFAVKGRSEQVALPILIADPPGLADLAEVPPEADRLATRYWPGPVTLVLPRRAGIQFDLGGDPATIGVRCPAHSRLRSLLREAGPLAVTSANRHGKPPLHTAEEVREQFGADVSVVVDGGRCDGQPSTVVSLVGARPICVREGAVSFVEIEAFLDRH